MLLPLLAALVVAPTDLTFVRHAETVANATGRYNGATLNALSAKGLAEVKSLTAELLKQPRYDTILVSPSPRALKTIAPYLRASHQKAVVWPLLYECCTGHRNASKPTHFAWGAQVTIPPGLEPYFVVQPGMDRLPASPEWGSGLAQVDATVREFRTRFSGERVLLVGHSGHGGQFLHALTGKWRKVENATLIRVRLSGG